MNQFKTRWVLSILVFPTVDVEGIIVCVVLNDKSVWNAIWYEKEGSCTLSDDYSV